MMAPPDEPDTSSTRSKKETLQKTQNLNPQVQTRTDPQPTQVKIPKGRKNNIELASYFMKQISGSERLSDEPRIIEPYLPSIDPLASLKKMMISDLVIDKHHRGSHILLRTRTPAVALAGVRTVAEDESGDAVFLELFNQANEGGIGAQEFLPQESVLIIKEPYLMILGQSDYCLRVDHPFDVVFLTGKDARIASAWRGTGFVPKDDHSASYWEEMGNRFMKESEYHESIIW
jgi:hypothetical protein